MSKSTQSPEFYLSKLFNMSCGFFDSLEIKQIRKTRTERLWQGRKLKKFNKRLEKIINDA